MIIKKYYATRADGVDLYRTCSDEGFKIQKIGTDEIYDEAIDVDDTSFTYEETDIPIDDEEGITDNEFISMLKEVL